MKIKNYKIMLEVTKLLYNRNFEKNCYKMLSEKVFYYTMKVH